MRDQTNEQRNDGIGQKEWTWLFRGSHRDSWYEGSEDQSQSEEWLTGAVRLKMDT